MLDGPSVSEQILERLTAIETRMAGLESRMADHDQERLTAIKAGAKRIGAVLSVLVVLAETVRGALAPALKPSESTHVEPPETHHGL